MDENIKNLLNVYLQLVYKEEHRVMLFNHKMEEYPIQSHDAKYSIKTFLYEQTPI